MKTKRTAVTKTRTRQHITLVASITLLSATGCGNFFVPVSSTTGATVVNSGDYVYVASANTTNTASPIYAISGFSVGTGTLTALSGSPVNLSQLAPVTMVVAPSNALLYVSGSEAVYGYTIASGGALTAIANSSKSNALVNANIVQMVVSPDGNWLLALDGTQGNGSTTTIHVYPISSTGQLGTDTPAQYTLTGGGTVLPDGIAISPNGDYVAVALGTGGDVLFSFTTSNGALNYAQEEFPPTTTSSDQAIAFDSSSSILFVARSGTDAGVVPYVIGGSSNPITLTAAAGAPFALGSGPSSIFVDRSGKYLYVGNKTDSTISGFSIGTGGVLTALSGSPYAAGTNVSAIGEDNGGKYILSTSLGSPDLKMFTLDTATAGKLDPTTTAVTGDPTEPAGAIAIALTH